MHCVSNYLKKRVYYRTKPATVRNKAQTIRQKRPNECCPRNKTHRGVIIIIHRLLFFNNKKCRYSYYCRTLNLLHVSHEYVQVRLRRAPKCGPYTARVWRRNRNESLCPTRTYINGIIIIMSYYVLVRCCHCSNRYTIIFNDFVSNLNHLSVFFRWYSRVKDVRYIYTHILT